MRCGLHRPPQGQKSHKIIEDGITALEHLAHRGACGCEVNTGDDARRPYSDSARLPFARLRA
jgi:glutamate synthase domain-containing protein 1